MPITIQFDPENLRPNYPNDRNAAGYFSHVKSWSVRDGAIYIPPTAGEYGRFARRIRSMPMTTEDNLASAKERLSQFNLWSQLGIDAMTFCRRFREHPGHSYGHRTNAAGTDAIQIIQTAFNMYAVCKNRYSRAWKVDYIHVAGNDMTNRQDDGFRGRCIFRLSNSTITTLIESLELNPSAFWVAIFNLYDRLAVHNYRIVSPDYADRPVVTRRRNQSTPSSAYTSTSVWNSPPPRTPPPTPREPAPNTRLAQEYLSRTIVDDSIPAEQLAEMLRRTGNALSGEVRDMIYDLLMADFNGSNR